MKFTDASPVNLVKLVEIYNHYVRNTTVTFNTKEVDTGQFLETFMADETRYVLRAVENENEVIGFCSASPFNRK